MLYVIMLGLETKENLSLAEVYARLERFIEFDDFQSGKLELITVEKAETEES